MTGGRMETPIIGVGLLLFLGGRLLIVKELKDKPQYHKRKGMLSFPLETFEQEKDVDIRGTINRLLQEELGIIDATEIDLWGIAPMTFRPIPGREDVEIYYGVGTFRGNNNRTFRPQDTDVEIMGWQTPQQLLNEKLKRVEVDPILRDFAKRIQTDFI